MVSCCPCGALCICVTDNPLHKPITQTIMLFWSLEHIALQFIIWLSKSVLSWTKGFPFNLASNSLSLHFRPKYKLVFCTTAISLQDRPSLANTVMDIVIICICNVLCAAHCSHGDCSYGP